jgi:ribosome biogenesis protein UTP30
MKAETKRKEQESKTKNLLQTGSDSSEKDEPALVEPIWLVLTTKKHITDQKRLKPGKIPLPHTLHKPDISTVCLITADPQRPFKDVVAHPSFPTTFATQITRVIGISKLLAKYKSFESRRQLRDEHDVFLADDRIVTRLPSALGKIFYSGVKRPIPVHLTPYNPKNQTPKGTGLPKDKSTIKIASPLQFAKEVETALSSAQVRLSPSVTTSIHIGSSNFKPEDLAENISAAVEGMITKFVPKGWRNIKSIHIKGPKTMALPIWLAEELWQEPDDVLENEDAAKAVEAASQKGKKRKIREGEDGGEKRPKKQLKKIEDEDLGNEMAERRAKLREAKRVAKEAVLKVSEEVSAEATKMKTLKLGDDKVKVKTKKSKLIEASA